MSKPSWATIASKDVDIPIVDFSAFVTPEGSTLEERRRCGQEVLRAFTDIGFVYLSNALAQETIDRAFELSKAFFAKSMEEKKKISWESFVGKRGYITKGREQIYNPDDLDKMRYDGKFTRDPGMKLHQSIKESFELGEVASLNQFPADEPEFAEFWQSFYVTMNSLYLRVLSSLALAFDLDEEYFTPLCDHGDNTLKTMHYMPVPKDIKGIRMMAHTDLELTTLLLQDSAGGLELRNTAGEWCKATPVRGCVTVNAGDLLMRWSNRLIRSTMHRVCPPPTPPSSEFYPSRYSIAFFGGPNADTKVEALPGTYKTKEEIAYPPVTAREFIGGGFNDLYGGGDLQKDYAVEVA